MRSSNEQGGYKYNEEIIKSIKMVLENYPKLEKIHEEGSIHSEEERKYEKRIEEGSGRLIEKLKELRKEDQR